MVYCILRGIDMYCIVNELFFTLFITHRVKMKNVDEVWSLVVTPKN